MLKADQKADILDRILDVLKEDMNLEQVCYCKDCHFWGTSGERMESSPIRHCRKYGQEKIWNDHCSDGLQRKEE